MVAYSFKPRFAEPILVGLGERRMHHVNPKRQTIRAVGKRRHARPGEVVQLYTGMRTKQCKSIGVAKCVSVEPIKIYFDYVYVKSYGPGRIEWGDPWHVCQGRENLDNFARKDGFADWQEMKGFWEQEHGLGIFTGLLIRWEPIR